MVSTQKIGLTARAFAKREGCSHTLVNDAVRDGFLRLFDDGTIDAGQLGSGWRKANRDPENISPASTRSRTGRHAKPKRILSEVSADIQRRIMAGDVVSVAEAEAAKQSALARRQITNARREADEVIDLAEAEAVVFEQFRIYRNSWLNWPVRVAPMIAAELGVEIDKIAEVLRRHVNEHLQELGEPDADFEGDK